MSKRPPAFTLIEFVMVVLLLSLLAAVAIPNFIDMRTDAKNASTKGLLGAFRSAIAVGTAAIALREDPASKTHKYPTGLEMQANAFNGSHPILSGTSILDPTNGIPKNPWTVGTVPIAGFSTIIDYLSYSSAMCGNPDQSLNGYLMQNCGAGGYPGRGWVYTQTSGQIWAGTANNNGSAAQYCSGGRTKEDCY